MAFFFRNSRLCYLNKLTRTLFLHILLSWHPKVKELYLKPLYIGNPQIWKSWLCLYFSPCWRQNAFFSMPRNQCLQASRVGVSPGQSLVSFWLLAFSITKDMVVPYIPLGLLTLKRCWSWAQVQISYEGSHMCISYLSITVITHLPKGSHGRQSLFGLWFQRNRVHCGEKCSKKRQAWNRSRSHSQGWSRESGLKCCVVFKPPKPISRDILPPAGWTPKPPRTEPPTEPNLRP